MSAKKKPDGTSTWSPPPREAPMPKYDYQKPRPNEPTRQIIVEDRKQETLPFIGNLTLKF